MRCEIYINQPTPSHEPVLTVLLFTNGHNDEDVYHSLATVSDDRSTFVSMIEGCVNACLDKYECNLYKDLKNKLVIELKKIYPLLTKDRLEQMADIMIKLMPKFYNDQNNIDGAKND